MLGSTLVIAAGVTMAQCLYFGPSELLQFAYHKLIPLGS